MILRAKQNLFQRTSFAVGRSNFAAHRGIVLALALRIGQAQHGFRQLVEQFLRLLCKIARRKLANVRVHLAVVFSNLGRIVFELLKPQQLVVTESGRSGS